MADFYSQKKAAYSLIEKLYNEGESENSIVYRVTQKYGFSEMATRKRLELLREISKEDAANE